MTGNNRPHILITERDRELLKSFFEYRLLDREQIQQLFDFGSVTRANDRLSKLHANGLLHRYFLGTKAGGRKALYALSSRGAGVVSTSKFWKFQRTEDELLVGEAFVEHQLGVNWCQILVQCGPDSKLNRIVRFNEPIPSPLPITPDAYMEFKTQGVNEKQPVFLEVDLGTETSRVWDSKIDRYLKMAASGDFERMFRRPRFKVAVVCTSERRMESLRRIVRKHTDKIFYFSLLQTIKSDGMRTAHWLRPEGEQRFPLA